MFRMRRRRGHEDGGSAMEYVVLTALISFSLIAVVAVVGGGAQDVFCRVGSNLAGTETCSSEGGGTSDPGTTPTAPPGAVSSPPLSTPWLPPSKVTTVVPYVPEIISDPSDPHGTGRPGLQSGDLGIALKPVGWVYGSLPTDCVDGLMFGCTIVQVVGDDGNIQWNVLAVHHATGWPWGTDVTLSPPYAPTNGDLVTADGRIAYQTCADGFDPGTVRNLSSIMNGKIIDRCGTHRLASITINSYVNGSYTHVKESVLYTSNAQLTVSFGCLSTSNGSTMTVSKTETGTVPTVYCPAGYVATDLTIIEDGNVVGHSLVDPSYYPWWVKAAIRASQLHLEAEENTGWCSINDDNGSVMQLPFSDCQAAQNEGLFS